MNSKSLSEIAYVIMGQSPKGESCNLDGRGRPLLNGPTEFGEFFPTAFQYTTSGNKFSKKGDILFCVRGSTTGRMNWSDQEYVLGRGLASISHKKGDKLNYFLKYLIESNIDSILKSTSGSTFPNLTREMLNSYKFILPSESSQLNISNLLRTLDSKIELNNRINAELEAMAKIIYEYWFVQFDFPYKKTGAEAAEALEALEAPEVPYKSSGGKLVYNKELKREIPEGWEVKKIKEFAETASGGTPLSSKTEYYLNGDIPWINSGEVNQPFIVSSVKFITNEGLNNSSAKIFKKGTILVAMYGATAGKISLMDIEACTNQAICAITPYNSLFRLYLKFGLNGLYKYLINLSSGSARDNLSQDKIRDLDFLIPTVDLLERFNNIVNPLFNKILVNLKENQQLSALRDWLLPMLMNGQVTVKEAEEN